jgi:hypothetical protein
MNNPPLTKMQLRIIDVGQAVRSDPPTYEETAFMTRHLIQATLPYREPKGEPPVWYRTNGNYTLSVRPGYRMETDPKTKKPHSVCYGYPYGTIPRLLMFWITTEALRTGSRKIAMGSTLHEFMGALGLNPDNGSSGSKRGDARRLRDQMERLFHATISFEYNTDEVRRWSNMDIAPSGEFWWDPKRPREGLLSDSWIELGEKFYESIIKTPVPVDMRALQVLKNSPFALDLYAWLTYKTFTVARTKYGRPQKVPWRSLQAQLGADYADIKDFKRACLEVIPKIQAVYPGVRVGTIPEGGGLLIGVGRPAVPSKQILKPN